MHAARPQRRSGLPGIPPPHRAGPARRVRAPGRWRAVARNAWPVLRNAAIPGAPATSWNLRIGCLGRSAPRTAAKFGRDGIEPPVKVQVCLVLRKSVV